MLLPQTLRDVNIIWKNIKRVKLLEILATDLNAYLNAAPIWEADEEADPAIEAEAVPTTFSTPSPNFPFVSSPNLSNFSSPEKSNPSCSSNSSLSSFGPSNANEKSDDEIFQSK